MGKTIFSLDSAKKHGDLRSDWPAVVFGGLALTAFLFIVSAPFWLGRSLPFDYGDLYLGVESLSIGAAFESMFLLQINFAGPWDIGEYDGLLGVLAILLISYFSSHIMPAHFRLLFLMAAGVVGTALVFGPMATAYFVFLITGYYLVCHHSSVEWLKVAVFFLLLAGGLLALGGDQVSDFAVVGVGFYSLAVGWALRRFKPRGIEKWTGVFTVGVFFTSIVVVPSETDETAFFTALFLFFSFGLRLLFNYFELRDRLVDTEQPFWVFCLNFLLIPEVLFPGWWARPGQGLNYLGQVYQNESRAKVILSGVESLFWGCWYFLVLTPVTFLIFTQVDTIFALPASSIATLYERYEAGLSYTMSDIFILSIREMLLYSASLIGILHYKVGLYRLFGFSIQSYTRYPWTATRLSEFWKRYGYHFVQLILRGFYLPMFLRLRHLPLRLRIYISVFYAVLVGQTISFAGMLYSDFSIWTMWPYHFLLAIGIAVSFSLESPKRAPWTLDRYIFLDFVRLLSILAFFSVIHIFVAPDANSPGRGALNLITHLLFAGN